MVIKEIDVKSVMTKSNLPVASGFLGQSLCWMHSRVQVLLRLLHEAVYQSPGAVG